MNGRNKFDWIKINNVALFMMVFDAAGEILPSSDKGAKVVQRHFSAHSTHEQL